MVGPYLGCCIRGRTSNECGSLQRKSPQFDSRVPIFSRCASTLKIRLVRRGQPEALVAELKPPMCGCRLVTSGPRLVQSPTPSITVTDNYWTVDCHVHQIGPPPEKTKLLKFVSIILD